MNYVLCNKFTESDVLKLGLGVGILCQFYAEKVSIRKITFYNQFFLRIRNL